MDYVVHLRVKETLVLAQHDMLLVKLIGDPPENGELIKVRLARDKRKEPNAKNYLSGKTVYLRVVFSQDVDGHRIYLLKPTSM